MQAAKEKDENLVQARNKVAGTRILILHYGKSAVILQRAMAVLANFSCVVVDLNDSSGARQQPRSYSREKVIVR